MTKNPYLNAFAAEAYIVFIVLLISYGPLFVRDKPDTMLAPMAMLSLLVCSVAFMGFAFFYQPVVMLLDGKRREAVVFFAQTLGSFAAITLFALLVAFAV